MAIPVLGWAAIVVISVVAGFSVYQLRLTVTEVTEVFTNKDSVFNSGIIQVGIAAVALYAVLRFSKG